MGDENKEKDQNLDLKNKTGANNQDEIPEEREKEEQHAATTIQTKWRYKKKKEGEKN